MREKTRYLSTLRSSVARLQDDINLYLTQRMEEDRAVGAGVCTKSTGKGGATNQIPEDELYDVESGEEAE